MNDTQMETEFSGLLWEHHALKVDRLEKLNLGADAQADVYKVQAAGQRQPFFLKTRPYAPVQPGVELPLFLSRLGIRHILSPLPTLSGRPSFHHRETSFILYPLLDGDSAMEKGLKLAQWAQLGATMRAVHSADLPRHITGALERECFAPASRELAGEYLRRILSGELDNGPGAVVSACLRRNADKIRHLIARAEALGSALAQRQDVPLVLCHADLHKWNIFVTENGEFYVIDWDSARLAPKECDLMFIGGNIGGDQGDAGEIPGFYSGYGHTDVDPQILAYYRFERIAVDMAEFCAQVWETEESTGAECRKIAGWLESNFAPGAEYDTACRSD
jgi:spectinomycin phosphotransferase